MLLTVQTKIESAPITARLKKRLSWRVIRQLVGANVRATGWQLQRRLLQSQFKCYGLARRFFALFKCKLQNAVKIFTLGCRYVGETCNNV